MHHSNSSKNGSISAFRQYADLIDSRARERDQLAELGHLRVDVFRESFRRVGDCDRADAAVDLLELWQAHDAPELRVQLVDDGARTIARREDSAIKDQLEILEAAFLHGRNVRCGCRSS